MRELANSLLFEVHDAIEDLPGSTPARKMLVDRALRYLDRLSHDAASDPSLQRELGMAYERVGTVQGNPFGANLGDMQGALQSYGKSLEIRRTLLETDPTNVEDRVAVARTERLMAATATLCRNCRTRRQSPSGVLQSRPTMPMCSRKWRLTITCSRS